jgi:predicted small secreted protein
MTVEAATGALARRREMMRDGMLRRLLVMVIAIGGLGLAGCNTISGIGRDVQAAGSAVTSTAEETKDEMTE